MVAQAVQAQAATPTATAGAEFSIHWVIEGLLAAVMTLATFIYKSHLTQYNNDKTYAKEQRREDLERAQQTKVADRVSAEQWQRELTKNVERLIQSISEERIERKRNEEELRREINEMKESTHNHRMQMAMAYHTKEDITQMFEQQLEPVLESLRDLKKAIHIKQRSGD